jgi:hypothetical protein
MNESITQNTEVSRYYSHIYKNKNGFSEPDRCSISVGRIGGMTST